MLILKGELQLYRNHYLDAEVAAHIVNASSACNLVYIKILQTVQVVLVRPVGKVLALKVEREKALAMELHVGTGIHISSGVRWRVGLRICGCEIMVLAEIAIDL